MSTEPNIIRYTFDLGHNSLSFDIDTAQQLSETRAPFSCPNEHLPSWTVLEKNQCACCPLKPENDYHCPAAVRIHQVLEAFRDSTSVEHVNLTVKTERRTYSQQCDLQSGLNSMLGLQMATSGCPIVGQLRAMATFHMPFSSFGETLYRAVSAHLVKQFYVHKAGGEADWGLKELQAFYETLEGLNKAFSERIRDIGQNDAISNAIVMFFAASIVVASSIEDGLGEYEDYFTGECATPPKGG
jgi:hypothetical protein